MSISVDFINNTGFIFKAEDYMTLRKSHRIIGNLIGSSLINSRNFNHKGLPAILNRFELQLLVEKNIVTLVNKSRLSNQPTEEEQLEFKCFQDSSINGQHELLRANKVNESRKSIEKILIGKEKKLIESGVKREDIHLSEDDILNEISNSYQCNNDNALIQIPTQHQFDVESTGVKLDVDSSLKYRVFKDLWECGATITSGESFGGDFLIYPGDPLYFHASHILNVIESGTISPVTLMGCGRVSVSVNKKCIFAFLDVEKDEIRYLNMSWEGNKSTQRLLENKDQVNS